MRIEQSPEQLPVEVPAGLLRWHRDGADYVAGRYRIALIEPRRWEIGYRGDPIGHDPSLKASLRLAEQHRRKVLRKRDAIAWGALVAVVSAVGAMAHGVLTVGTIPWYLVMVVLAWTAVSALVRMVAALTANPRDPYRRRLPWERRGPLRRAAAEHVDELLDRVTDPPPAAPTETKVRTLPPR